MLYAAIQKTMKALRLHLVNQDKDLLICGTLGNIKKQEVKFNINIDINPSLFPSEDKLNSIVNYEAIIREITKIAEDKHYELLETLAEEIFSKLFCNINIKKIKLKIEKTQIIKNTSSVGIEIVKKRL